MWDMPKLTELVKESIQAPFESDFLKEIFEIDTSAVYYKYLYDILKAYRGEETLTVELGTWHGRSTAFLADGNPSGKVLTVDVYPLDSFVDIRARYKNIVSYVGRSDEAQVLDTVEEESVDVCFFDTVHEYDVVSKEVSLWYPKIKNGGVMLFDDIFLNEGMIKFWNELPFNKNYSTELHWTGFGYVIK